MHAKVLDGKVVAYPYNYKMLRADNPNVSFANSLNSEDLRQYNVYIVEEVAKPIPNEKGHVVFELLPTFLADKGRCRMTWESRIPTEIELGTIERNIVKQVQQQLDAFAQSRGYDSVDSVAKYALVTDSDIAAMSTAEQVRLQKFKEEALIIANKAAMTWAILYSLFDKARSAEIHIPTEYNDIKDLLPQLVW